MMRKLKRVLVGLDQEPGGEALSAGSRTAARQALWLAERTGARVDFLHSTWTDPEDSSSDPGIPAGIEGQVEAIRQELGVQGADPQVFLTEERPWIDLTRRVIAGDADLLVVAKRSHRRRDDRRLGSVSLKLVRNCPGPVWVVRPEHELRHRFVLAATDLTAVGDLATEYGAFIAQAEECELGIVHAWQVPMDLQLSARRLGAEEAARGRRAIADGARQHIRGLPGVQGLGDQAKVIVTCDSPSRLILQVAEEKDPDLVVMGTISRGGLAGMLVGNTAEKLLHRLDCSLLTVKPEDFVCPLKLDDAAAG